MKSILTVLTFFILIISGFSQTRNVVVGTNGAVVQPTNFWSADVTNARSGLGLGSAATNVSSAFQRSSLVLSNLSYSNASNLTNVSAASIVGVVANASNITGTAALATNVVGIVSLTNGGTGATNAASARTSLGATVIGTNLFTLANPSEVSFLRLNANNTVSSLNAVDFRNALSAGTVTSVGMSVPNIFSLNTSTITSSGTFAITLGNQTSRQVFIAPNGGGVPSFRALDSDDLPSLAISKITGLQNGLDGKLSTSGTAALATNITGIVAVANGGTGASNESTARTSLGATTVGGNLFTLANPDETRFLRINANNTVSSLNVSDFRNAISAGTVTSVGMSVPNIFSLSTSSITSSGTFALGLTNQSSRQVFIAPNGGGTPVFRAIESDDLPSLAISKVGGLQTALDGKLPISGTAPLATNVTGVVAIANGGTGGSNESTARTSLGATTIGANLFTLPNSDEIRFLRLNANNTASSLNAADFRNALSVGTNAGTVTSIGMTVPSIFSLNTSTITSSGTFGISLANQTSRQALIAPNGGGVPTFRGIESDDLPSLAISKVTGLQTALDGKLSTSGTAALATNVTGIISLANGGTGGTNVSSVRYNLGATTVGENIFTLFNPSAIRFLRINADNTVSAISDSDFRTSIGLGTASTNPSSAFQPSSSGLTNLAANNGSSLTNISVSGVIGALATNGNGFGLTNLNASNITGVIPASNISTINVSNISGTIVISSGGTGATNAATARTNLGLGNTNSVSFGSLTIADETYVRSAEIGWDTVKIQFEERFFEAGSGSHWTFNQAPFFYDAAGTRDNLGLGSSWLTNTNVTNFRTAIGLGSTNTVTFGNVGATSIMYQGGATTAINLSDGILRNVSQNVLEFGDTVAIYAYLPIAFISNSFAATTRNNLGLGATWLTNTNVANFRTNIGLGLEALTNTSISNFLYSIGLDTTNNAFGALSVGVNITNNSTKGNASSAFGRETTIDSTVENSLAVGFSHSMSNFGNGAGGSVLLGGMGVMTNWGAFLFNGVQQGGAIGYSRGNSTFAVNASNGIFLNGPLRFENVQGASTESGILQISAGGTISRVMTNKSTATPAFFGWDGFSNTAFSAAQARTNLGLSWSALTNTNSGTAFVSVNSTGVVVSPTNFWTASPLGRVGYIQYSAPITNSTNAAEAARNLFLFSLAPSISGVTNTIQLPVLTNGALYGDIAVVVHKGPTNSTTIVRNGIDLITLTNTEEAISLLYASNGWDFYPNLAFHDPIYFTTTNALLDAARSRTNLGLPLTALTNTNAANFQASVFSVTNAPTNSGNITFGSAAAWIDVNVFTNGSNVSFRVPLFNKP